MSPDLVFSRREPPAGPAHFLPSAALPALPERASIARAVDALGLLPHLEPSPTGDLRITARGRAALAAAGVHEAVAVRCPECHEAMLVTPEQAAHPILPCSTACEDRAAARDEGAAEEREARESAAAEVTDDADGFAVTVWLAGPAIRSQAEADARMDALLQILAPGLDDGESADVVPE